MAFDMPSDYNTVPERIVEFREKYPEGSLGEYRPWQLVSVGDKTFLAYTAAAYRSPEDTRPGIGSAWELVPGPTPYTKNSELQNAETSAWGRAIIAVGAADAKKGVASAEDVRNRQAEHEHYEGESRARVCVSCGKPATGTVVPAPGGYRHKVCPPVTA